MDKPKFYKYLDVKGAKLTLTNKTFKHAKPSDFNDTEDLTIQSIFPDDLEIALQKLEHSFMDIILQHLSDHPTCEPPIKEDVALIQKVCRSNPGAADLLKDDLIKQTGKPIFDVDRMRALGLACIKEINDSMQNCRVLCVTTLNDSEEMWTRYAENHKGVALRIEPNSDKDSKFQLFRPVVYREKRPPLYDNVVDFIAGSLFGDQEHRRREVFNKIIYAKTLTWQQEREYRLVIPLMQGEPAWNTLPYRAEEITELYLGLAMEETDSVEIQRYAHAINPDIAFFKVKRGGDGKIRFDRL